MSLPLAIFLRPVTSVVSLPCGREPCEIIGVEPNAEDLTFLGAIESLCAQWVIISCFYVECLQGVSVLFHESDEGVLCVKRHHRRDVVYYSPLCHWRELGGWVDKGKEYGIVELVKVLVC